MTKIVNGEARDDRNFEHGGPHMSDLLNRAEEAVREVDDYYISIDQVRAVLAVALEEAARVAENISTEAHWRDADLANLSIRVARNDIAAAIRALKDNA